MSSAGKGKKKKSGGLHVPLKVHVPPKKGAKSNIAKKGGAAKKHASPKSKGVHVGKTKFTLSAAFEKKLKSSVLDVPKVEAKIVDANGRAWSDLAKIAAENSASIFQHDYSKGLAGKKESILTTHTHGDFGTKIVHSGGEYVLPKLNISTAAHGGKARSLDALAEDIKEVGSGDVLRVLKGTHVAKGLKTADAGKRASAVELAAEIGISEYSRGGTNALRNAASALYSMKHGEMKVSEFVDFDVGYRGAGGGGAERLRKLKGGSDTLHLERLQAIYLKHAVNKPGKAWTGQNTAQGFEAWLTHKVTSWSKRET